MMYLTRIPFNGSIIATVTGEDDPRLPELIAKYAKGQETKVIDDEQLNVVFSEYEGSLVTPLESTTEARFDDSLEILPPSCWGTVKGVEMYFSPERIFGSIVSWYFKYNGKFYTCDHYCYADKNLLADLVIKA